MAKTDKAKGAAEVRVGKRGRRARPRSGTPTLGELGISKDLSSRAQKLAAVPERVFESKLATWRERTKEENECVSTKRGGSKSRESTLKKPGITKDLSEDN